MSSPTLIRWSGLSLAAGGILIALFILTLPNGQFVTADAVASSQSVLAHSLHAIGAALLLLGVTGWYARMREKAGRFGLISFVVAFVGCTLFGTTGSVFATVLPTVAHHSPELFGVTGPLFELTSPFGIVLGFSAVFLYNGGFMLMSIAALRAGMFPRWATVLVILTALVFATPPQPIGPMPWAGQIIVSLMYAIGLGGIGLALWSSATSAAPVVSARAVS